QVLRHSCCKPIFPRMFHLTAEDRAHRGRGDSLALVGGSKDRLGDPRPFCGKSCALPVPPAHQMASWGRSKRLVEPPNQHRRRVVYWAVESGHSRLLRRIADSLTIRTSPSPFVPASPSPTAPFEPYLSFCGRQRKGFVFCYSEKASNRDHSVRAGPQ